MNVGKPSPELKERNESLYNDFKLVTSDGSRVFSTVELVKKYGVSQQRIAQIVKKQEEKLN